MIEPRGWTMTENSKQNPPNYVDRAPRFPIQTSLHYRQGGEVDWHEGTTVNISRTGILFHPDHDIDLQTVLEMRIIFPTEITGTAPTRVVCWGPVVRSETSTGLEPLPMIAASILRYRFSHD